MEPATGGVQKKKMSLKIVQYSQKKPRVEFLFSKVGDLQAF